ncbi:MAG TPA: delta-60 repeat domain-containing protein [Polyangiaceae bacterium]
MHPIVSSPARRPRALLSIALASVLGASAGCGQILGIEPGTLTSTGDAGPASPADAGLASPADTGTTAVSSPEGGSDSLDASPEQDAGTLPPPATGSEFAITAETSKVTLVRGGAAQVAIAISASGPRSGPVTVTATGLPAGVWVDPLSVPATATGGTLTLHAITSTTLTVTAALQITGTSGPFSHDVTVPLFVQDPSGSLDVTFGSGGIATVPLAGGRASAGIGLHGLAIQPDGAIVFCGNGLFGQNYELVLGRLTPSGNLDASFASGGLAVMNEPGHWVDVCSTVSLLGTGSLIVSGFTVVPNDSNYPHTFLVSRFSPTGQLDPSFGSGGFFNLEAGGVDAKPYDLVPLPDGKLLLGGFAGSNLALLQLTPAGTVDTTYGTKGDGTSLLAPPNGAHAITALALLPDGNVLGPIDASSFLVERFTPAGSLDATYGASGQATAPAPPSPSGAPFGVVLQPDGKAVVAGNTTPSSSVAGAVQLARFDTAGALDKTFGQDGVASTTFPGGSATTSALVRMPDGRFVVGATLPTSAPIGIVRYDATGALDTAFAGTGYTGVAGYSYGDAVALDDAGRIVISAFAMNATEDTASVVVARFWP